MTSDTSPLSKGRAGSRRGFLFSAASVAGASLAGCAGGSDKAPTRRHTQSRWRLAWARRYAACAMCPHKRCTPLSEAQGKFFNEMASALTSFAKDGNARFASGQAWPLYQPGKPTSARIGEGGSSVITLGPIPKLAQMAAWDALLGY